MNRLIEKGFSLIEFMIAIAISMIVLLAVSIAWQTGMATQQTQTDDSRLNETVRFAVDLLSREIRQAGLTNKATTSHPDLNFCSAANITTKSVIAGLNDPINIDPTIKGMTFNGNATTISNLSDVIRVRYYGDNTGEVDNTGNVGVSNKASNISDCLGNPIINPAANASASIIEDTLYVAPDPNNPSPGNPAGEPALWCYTSNPNSTPLETGAYSNGFPLVAGVESLKILYGEDLDLDGIINHYVPLPTSLPVPNFDNVLSVKVSIVARSANAVTVGLPVAKTYNHFGTGSGITFTSPADNRLRLPQPMSTEIAIRNFSNCSVQF